MGRKKRIAKRHSFNTPKRYQSKYHQRNISLFKNNGFGIALGNYHSQSHLPIYNKNESGDYGTNIKVGKCK